MMFAVECPVCGDPHAQDFGMPAKGHTFKCPHCGTFERTASAAALWTLYGPGEKQRALAAARQECRSGLRPRITSGALGQPASPQPPRAPAAHRPAPRA